MSAPAMERRTFPCIVCGMYKFDLPRGCLYCRMRSRFHTVEARKEAERIRRELWG